MLDPIAAQLRSLRKARKLSQTEVGRLFGNQSYQCVHQWETGTQPTLSRLRAWAGAFGLEPLLSVQGAGRPWYRVLRVGQVWCETSDLAEAIERRGPGDKLQRSFVRTVHTPWEDFDGA